MSAHEAESDRDGDEEEAFVPAGVLEGIEDIAEGRTASDEEFRDALKF